MGWGENTGTVREIQSKIQGTGERNSGGNTGDRGEKFRGKYRGEKFRGKYRGQGRENSGGNTGERNLGGNKALSLFQNSNSTNSIWFIF